MYNVISPDGYSIHREDTYPTKEKARLALKKWIKRFEQQGYYSSSGGRISLEELYHRSRIVKINRKTFK